jgi:hypothetical protein
MKNSITKIVMLNTILIMALFSASFLTHPQFSVKADEVFHICGVGEDTSKEFYLEFGNKFQKLYYTAYAPEGKKVNVYVKDAGTAGDIWKAQITGGASTQNDGTLTNWSPAASQIVSSSGKVPVTASYVSGTNIFPAHMYLRFACGIDFLTIVPTYTMIPGLLKTLTVSKSGSGAGTVTSNPSGINCGSTCSYMFFTGTVVTLTPTPSVFSSFDGWSGDADCSDGVVTMGSSKNCTAKFKSTIMTIVPTYTMIPGLLKTLTVSKSGSGAGTVTSNPSGINCGSTCSYMFFTGTVVTLTATPTAGSVFVGYSGNADCTDGSVTMGTNKNCTATFDSVLPTQGTLTIVSNVGGYNIFLNGIFQGIDTGDGIATIPLNPGNYNIVIQHIGCSPASGFAMVTAGANTSVNLPMICAIPPTTAPPTSPPTVPPTYPPTLPPTYPPTLPPTAPPNNPPHADAGRSQSVNVGDIVAFDGSGSSDSDGDALTFQWDFGDGQTGAGPRPIHQYYRAGQYPVSVTVSDGQSRDTAYVTIIVNEKPGFSLGGNMLLYVGLGVISLLLIILIIVMLARR